MAEIRDRRVAVVLGTRPETIKLAPVVFAIGATPGLVPQLIVTGQHRELLSQALDLFGLMPDRDLELMRPGQDLFDVTAGALLGLRQAFRDLAPDYVVVQGDTTTSMAAALSAFYLGIPVGHVEAGLRTFDLRAPFPEEANRRLTAVLADLHFAPTPGAAAHLAREGVSDDRVIVTGNTGIDALHWVLENRKPALALLPKGRRETPERPYLLVTLHRRESFGEPLDGLVAALAELARSRLDHDIYWPVHPNPHVAATAARHLTGVQNVFCLPPQPYGVFVNLLAHARLVLTDSGGIQEEAPSLGKPVLVLRDTTERPEGILAGAAELVGTRPERLLQACARLLDDPAAYQRMAQARSPYGDGHAAEKIARAIAARLR